MFARTDRLVLRPAWPEDAKLLSRLLDHPDIAVHMAGRGPGLFGLASPPVPFLLADDPRMVARLPGCLAFLRTRRAPRLVGGCEMAPGPDGAPPELHFWIERGHWGLGFATEMVRAVMHHARATGISGVEAMRRGDNPSAGRVLRKAGFSPAMMRHDGVVRRSITLAGDAVPVVRYHDDGAMLSGDAVRAGVIELYPDATLAAA